jgi:hypothetical protein
MIYSIFVFILGAILLYIGISSIFKKNYPAIFKREEAKRYLFKGNEIDDNWSSNGLIYTEGLALIEDKKNNKKDFIKQAELCDIGILS